jgi:UDP:flavonoid glycosyltransferase YjiC (YdhE family)
MQGLRVLYVSGSLGLGHVTRDIAIARELRRQVPEVDIRWLAAHPASQLLEEAGETLVPEVADYVNENEFAERSSHGSSLNLLSYVLKARHAWERNTQVFARIVGAQPFDLVIGDETYEISLALRKHRELKKFLFVMIFDFVGLEAMTGNPLERLGVYVYNRKWALGTPSHDLALFVGEPGDVPDTPFGFRLPNRRRYASERYEFVGYVLPFDPAALADPGALRERLGYGREPLVIAAVGGTSIGRELLELSGRAYPLLREKLPSLRMVLVSGPRIGADSLEVPAGVEVRPFVPRLYEHFAACDVAIVQGGATSATELTALKRPFIYFPLEGHSEQANVARILRGRGVGTEMKLSTTTAASLAGKVAELCGGGVAYPGIPTDGARRAAQSIARLLVEHGKLAGCATK